jgi:hypothetical protein
VNAQAWTGLTTPGINQVIYTPVHVSIPLNGSYNLDVNGDGIAELTLRPKLIKAECQSGDEYIWSLIVNPSTGNAVVVEGNGIGYDYAAALAPGVLVNASQGFYLGFSIMAEIYWGACGTGTSGEWLNRPGRYLGFEFLGPDHVIHYGWALVSSVAYVDSNGQLQTSTILSGFAYETTAGQGLLTGQTSGEKSP